MKNGTSDDGSGPGAEVYELAPKTKKLGTDHDRKDMKRMGKEQLLQRNFKLFSIFGYSAVLGCTWEFALLVGGLALLNGGTGGGIWMFFTVCVGFFFVMLSMAELASMAPTAGGQYHWVSEIAPRKHQKFLSYMVGWLCVIGWQAGMCATCFATAQQIEALIVLWHPDYVVKGWHGTLMCIAVMIACIFFNTVLMRKLPLIEGIVTTLHIIGFLTFVIVLWVMAPRGDASVVFTDFQDNAGWGNVGLSCLVGLLGPVLTLTGSDSACHLSEELIDASWSLPRAMFATATVNYSLGFIMTITFMMTLGPDLDQVLTTPTGQPYVQILLNATESRGATTVLTVLMCFMLFFCSVNQVTTSSRQLFAFARDRGMPYSDFLAKVKPGWDIPLNALTVTMIVTFLLSLVIIGSTIAFSIITSLSQLGLTSSYLVAVACILHRRLKREPLLPSRFSLGRAGLLINILALCFLILIYIFMFFPAVPNPELIAMNWSIVIYGAAVLFAIIYYYLYARHQYAGPVEYVRTGFYDQEHHHDA